jgi:hypothetical protein
MPETTFFAFLFHPSYFHLFTTNVTQALSLEAIKGEVGATSRAIGLNRIEFTSIKTTTPTHTHHPSKET